ncbi:MAG: ComEC/Rec2 family competence protein, partial [Planctomycetota bacterium]
AWLFRLGVAWVGTWPGCSCTISPMPWWWAVVVLLATFAWWLCRPALRRFAITLMLVCWGACGLAATHATSVVESTPDHIFRWTSIAIGDGSVHLIEVGGSTVLCDAGSISRTSAGSNTIVPALRACGVRRIDAVLVSHPHLDHFSALPELLGAFPVARVLLTEPWFRDVRFGSAPGALLDCLKIHGIEPERVTQGFTLQQGAVTWRCVHPPPGFRASAVNDGSAAFVLTHEGLRDRPLALLVGDAQDQAIARLLTRRDILQPWVMEIPHHGGWRPLAQTLCEWVRPSFVMQSTGARRFRRDRFEPCLRTAVRGATCRDGALRFSLDPSNLPPTLEHWSGQAWVPLRPQ